jgi:PAS domain S-box-containing protein
MSDLRRELVRGVVIRTGKRLDEFGQRLATLFASLFTSRDLQESKARLEEAQRVAHIGHYYWDLDANRVVWSDELYRIYGLTPQKGPIDMAMVREMMHPDDRVHVFRTAEEAIRSTVHTQVEHRVVRPDGEVRTVHALGTVKRDASGRPYQIFGTVQDITDRKRAEEALQQTQFYLKEGQRLAHMGAGRQRIWVSVGLTIWVSIGLTRCTKFTVLTPRTGLRTLNSIWPPSTLMIGRPWLKPSRRCMSSAVAVT